MSAALLIPFIATVTPSPASALAWRVVNLTSLITAVAGLLWTAWLLLHFFRDRSRFRAGRCINCGYDLHSSHGNCPECGEAIP